LKETLKDWMAVQRMVTLRLVDSFRADLQRLNVDLIHGHGEFLDDRTLRIIDEHGLISTITAENIVVATGSRPDFQDNSRPRVMNSDELLTVSALPERLVIIGAGYVGCEFASIYRTLGSEVTLIEKANRILPGWEAEAADRVAEAFEMRGVNVMRNSEVAFREIVENETGVRVRCQTGQPVDADVVLVATGRVPNLRGTRSCGIGDRRFFQP